MATNVTLHAGHDVAYFTSGQGRGGCAGAMSYYTAAGEPPGEWAGKGAVALGLSGQVDPGVIGRLYQQNIGPGGELLVKRPRLRRRSIYRPPNEERYCSLAHLDTEEQILAAAKRTVPQLVSNAAARAAAEQTGLNGEQHGAVVMMLTATAATTVLIAPAGGGQEPHHGRVRPAVDHVHRPSRHRPDHLHQRRPGAAA